MAASRSYKAPWMRTKLAEEEWEPRPCCVRRRKYDKRTPGLFKVEWKGEGMVGLCSKTYFGWGADGDKASSKGVSKKHTELTKERYLNVLKEKRNATGVNIGFRMKGGQMHTYQQSKDALSYLYIKRKVCLLYTSDAADD